MLWSKRIIAAFVSICLLGAAVFFAYQPEAVSAGAGNGVNTPVQTITDLDKVFASMEHLGSSVGPSARTETAQNFYTSMSLTETSDLSSQTFVSTNYGSASSSTSFRRTLDIYLTEGAVYYVTRGVTSAKTSQDIRNTHRVETSYFAFDFCIYMSAERVLIKADQLEFFITDSTSEEPQEPDELYKALRENRGEWLDCTEVPEVAEQLLSINSSNMDAMDQIGSLISQAKEDDTLFTQIGSLYTMAVPPEAGVEVEFTIDFSNSVAPYLTFDINASDSESGGTGSLREKIEFRYVDNTVISLEDTMDPIDFAALMSEEGGDER